MSTPQNLIKAIVIGTKTFGAIRVVKGVQERFTANSGDEVLVTIDQLRAFPQRLATAAVAAAQQAAREAQELADEELSRMTRMQANEQTAGAVEQEEEEEEEDEDEEPGANPGANPAKPTLQGTNGA